MDIRCCCQVEPAAESWWNERLDQWWHADKNGSAQRMAVGNQLVAIDKRKRDRSRRILFVAENILLMKKTKFVHPDFCSETLTGPFRFFFKLSRPLALKISCSSGKSSSSDGCGSSQFWFGRFVPAERLSLFVVSSEGNAKRRDRDRVNAWSSIEWTHLNLYSPLIHHRHRPVSSNDRWYSIERQICRTWRFHVYVRFSRSHHHRQRTSHHYHVVSCIAFVAAVDDDLT